MAVPIGFDNKIRLVVGSPVGADEINGELATQNAVGYWMTSLEFLGANNCLMLFCKTGAEVPETAPQKVNLVAVSQSAINADKNAEESGGFWPTGVFITPGGDLLVFYQQLAVMLAPS